jgi:predicted nucleotidyltransferase
MKTNQHFQPKFPTQLHEDTAQLVKDFFLPLPNVDTILIVNSCARGQAVPESDLDFAILMQSGTHTQEIANLENVWQNHQRSQPRIQEYKRSHPYAHLHLDLITGHYEPQPIEVGEPIDYFEIEIGNQIAYSAPMGEAGAYFQELQATWLPYYPETLRLERLEKVKQACQYDLDHIPHFVRRGLHFQALDILIKAFQEYLQALFIAHQTYPIAYNKWIKMQVAEWLKLPELYSKLPGILSIADLESEEVCEKAAQIWALLDDL